MSIICFINQVVLDGLVVFVMQQKRNNVPPENHWGTHYNY